MNNIKRLFPVIVIVSLSILGANLLLEGSKGKPKVVTDEASNEFTLGVEGTQSSSVLGIGDEAPNFVLNSYDGNIVNLKELYTEKPVIIQFWATWCHICEQEFPENNKYTQENKDKFHFVAVNWGQTGKRSGVLR